MKNKLIDLNNHLFAQLERLGDEDLKTDDIERELKRTDAIVQVSDQIVKTANTAIKAATLIAENGEGEYIRALPEFSGQPISVINSKPKKEIRYEDV